MNKNTKIVIGIVLFFILLAGGLYFAFSYMNKTQSGEVIEFENGSPIFGGGGGGGGGETTATTTGGFEFGTTTEEGEVVFVPQLRQIYSEPTSGFFVGEKQAGNVRILFTDRATGHIYETSTSTQEATRITNTTIPKTQEVVWLNSKSSLYRYFTDSGIVKTFYAEISDAKNDNEEEVEKSLEGVFLPDNIKEVYRISDRNIFYTLVKGDNTSGVLARYDGGGASEIVNLPLKELNTQASNSSYAILTTSPSFEYYGYAYLVNLKSGSFRKILDSIKGLTVLMNKNNTQVLYSDTFSNSLGLNILNIATKETQGLGVNVLPEKCVWSNDNVNIYCGVSVSYDKKLNYPDDWYKGKASFTDEIWQINTKTKAKKQLVSPSEFVSADIDLINPTLDSDEKYLFFINKKDLSFWSLQLEK